MSPEALFTCPPCSVRFPRVGAEPARRKIYCSVTEPNPKLHYFSERSSLRAGQSRNFSTFTAELTDSRSPITNLEIIGNEESDPLQSKVLAIHADGEVRCFSHDLKVQEWKATTSSQVEFALVMNLKQAQQTILKSREDILAMLASNADASEPHILTLVTRSSDHSSNVLHFRIVRIGMSDGAHNPLRELASLTLPEPSHYNHENQNYSWHGRSGSLLQHNSNTLIIYDLAGYVPRLTHHVDLGKEKIASCLFINPCLIAINTKTSVSILDVRYRSIQGKHSFDQALAEKYPHGASTRLLSYFATSELMVALRGRKILAIQISMGEGSEPRKRKRDGMLINSIGRSVLLINKKHKATIRNAPKALGAYLDLSDSSTDWSKRKNILDDLFAKDNLEEFERAIGAEIGIIPQEEDKEFKSTPDLRKIQYTLSKIFSVEDSSKADLKISWLPNYLSRWLIGQGLFSIDQIEASLKLHGSLPRTSNLRSGIFVQAVTEWDRSLELLLLILKSPVSLETNEVVHALRELIILDFPKDIKLLTNGGIENNDISMDSVPTIMRLDKNSIAHAVFESTMVRLTLHPTSKISQALKKELSISELRSLVDLLRTELVKGRWLSPHTEEGIQSQQEAEEEEEDPLSGDQLHSIARLFNCAIDSIGTGGWLTGPTSTNEALSETADTIAHIKAEISAALEGIEEAAYLKGMLETVLLHGRFSSSSTHRDGHGAKPVLQLRPANADVAEDVLSRSALPLGLDAAHGLSTKKVGAGGRLLDRSRRDMGDIRNRMVGKYSFERILV